MSLPELFALLNQGRTDLENGNYLASVECFQGILTSSPDCIEALLGLGRALMMLDRVDSDQVIGCFQRAIQLDPACTDGMIELAEFQRLIGLYSDAVENCQRCLALDPTNDKAVTLLGFVYETAGAEQPAIDALGAFVAGNPSSFEGHYQLGFAQYRVGFADESLQTMLLALALKPNSVKALRTAGMALSALSQVSEAVDIFLQGLSIEPENLSLLKLLIEAYNDLGLFDEAIHYARLALKISCNDPVFLRSLAILLRHIGNLDESIAILDDLIAKNPDDVDSCYVQLFNYSISPASLAPKMLAMAAHYWSRCESLADKAYISTLFLDSGERKASCDSSRKLRIGVLSGDIGAHVVGAFLRSFLKHYDRQRLHVELIGTNRRYETEAEELINLADHYLSIQGVSVHGSRRLIIERNYDLIIETSGFTRNSGLHVLAQRCAPVQCHYIGYHATTGLETIDYYIGDSEITPPEFSGQFSERLIRLPRLWIAYDPGYQFPRALSVAKYSGPILGSFNQLAKVRNETLEYWAAAMARLSGSVLAIKDRGAYNQSNKERIREYLSRCSISPERILFYTPVSSFLEHLDCYNGIDIALDATPWSSATTAFEALGMGVPLVAIRGDSTSSRMSSSIVSSLGHPEWRAANPSQFANIASELCDDLPRLRNSKSELQRKALNSRLFDSVELANDLTLLIEKMVDDKKSSMAD